ncbi:copper amine oxidase N-terminal domain-containing protein [Heyndrickxia oleronia]|uniref:Copper amine oxidase N-terminal domain-containing protein n=1 Tax=Heyndrickxia oleronia TaxID=38875 RepID=A0AAW6SZZ7_9BACI|nr:copper amine oxidase N-terminal domain-containing protein [Heyndrickxia oleronia]MDH5162599.1 copper amine oxidase N-terminal domain-containing protein [Heyndrickxia oleronia]
MKKSLLIAPLLIAGLSLPHFASASTNDVTINDGKIENGRTLVPIRAISQSFGSTVDWHQTTKTVTIKNGKDKTVLTVNSKKINVNGKTVTIDVPVRMSNGTTYVPLRVASPAGSVVEWNQKAQQATITFKGKKVVVNVGKTGTGSTTTTNTQFTETLKKNLIAKADETANLSKISQIRTHFKPYFTTDLINKIVYQNDFKNSLKKVSEFKNAPSASISVGNEVYVTHTLMSQGSNGVTTYYNRTIVITKADGTWKVSDIRFSTEERDHQMNG